jgi:hypothetical protein
MMRHTLRAGAALGLLVALGLLLASCGGGETTLTITETVASKPAKHGGKGSRSDKPETQQGAVAGYVDFSKVEGDSLVVSGWAASSDLSEPATEVAAQVGGKVVAEAVPAIKREDVADALGKTGLLESGFELRLPVESLECGTSAAGVKVVGSLNGKASMLPYGEGIKEALTEAC